MAYVISEDCIACGTCIDECPMGAISEGDIYTIDACAQSAALVLMFAQVAQFPKDKLQIALTGAPKHRFWGSFFIFLLKM